MRSCRTDFLDFAGLPGGARIGTSSLRREAQLRERDPLLSILPLRGNVNTRLAKLDDGRYDAIILAAAGLKRLGFAERIASYLDPEESLPAAGQGALAVECRSDRADLLAALAPLADRDSTVATTAERAFARALSGSCHTPLAAYAIFVRDELWLRGLLAGRDGATVMRGERRGPLRRRLVGGGTRPHARAGVPGARRRATRFRMSCSGFNWFIR